MTNPLSSPTSSELVGASDNELAAWACGVIAVPKQDVANSFVLHAPLELMARVALLSEVAPEYRPRTRDQIIHLVSRYVDSGPNVRAPRPVSPSSTSTALVCLREALSVADIESVDAYALWIGEHLDVADIRTLLGPVVAPSLGAAAHGSIGLHLLGRSPSIDGTILRGALREIGRRPELRIESSSLRGGQRPLVEALLETPPLGMPENDFIYPMVQRGAPIAEALLTDVAVDPLDASRSLGRVAAWSMIQESPVHSPYGWTHALTIPQAVTSIGLDANQSVAVGARQVIGLRASMGEVRLDPTEPIANVSVDELTAITGRAAGHHDAHFAKYALACRDASSQDPEMASLYAASLAKLNRWWDDHDATS